VWAEQRHPGGLARLCDRGAQRVAPEAAKWRSRTSGRASGRPPSHPILGRRTGGWPA
jgi:hypothetical protein